jgi:hypothetical protein
LERPVSSRRKKSSLCSSHNRQLYITAKVLKNFDTMAGPIPGFCDASRDGIIYFGLPTLACKICLTSRELLESRRTGNLGMGQEDNMEGHESMLCNER